jgi:hypothetical protein
MNARTTPAAFDLMNMGKPASQALLGALGFKADWDRVTLPEIRLILNSRPAADLFGALVQIEDFDGDIADFEFTPGASKVFDTEKAAAAVAAVREKRLFEGRTCPADDFVDAALAALAATEPPAAATEPPAALPGWNPPPTAPAAGPTVAASPAAKPAPVTTAVTLTPPAATTAAAALADALAAMLAATPAGTAALDEGRVTEIAAEAVAAEVGLLRQQTAATLAEHADAIAALAGKGGQAVTLTVKTAADVAVTLEGEFFHPMFEKVLRLVSAGLNVMLVGAAGTGKTYMVEQVARALGRNFGSLSLTAGASESQLTGWLMPIGEGGRFEYMPSQFVRLYEGGESVFLLDEMDRADANMLMIGNSALANDYLNVPQRHEAPTVRRGKNAAVVAACNTHGTGMDYVYAAANVLDGASLDRFYIVAIDYDPAFEARLVGRTASAPAWKAEPADVGADLGVLHDFVTGLRSKAGAAKLNRVVSTRMLQKGITARKAGVPLAEVKRDLLAGWTRDEMSKCGIYV